MFFLVLEAPSNLGPWHNSLPYQSDRKGWDLKRVSELLFRKNWRVKQSFVSNLWDKAGCLTITLDYRQSYTISQRVLNNLPFKTSNFGYVLAWFSKESRAAFSLLTFLNTRANSYRNHFLAFVYVIRKELKLLWKLIIYYTSKNIHILIYTDIYCDRSY